MSENIQAQQAQKFCQFCPHLAHGRERCSQCRCKGKRGFWRTLLGGLGNAIGEAKFDQ